jgi:hypothetical protein
MCPVQITSNTPEVSVKHLMHAVIGDMSSKKASAAGDSHAAEGSEICAHLVATSDLFWLAKKHRRRAGR